jgi:hypothetical protein
MNVAVALLFMAVFVIVGAMDLLTVYRTNDTETVSSVLANWSQCFPILPFAVGVIVGHIFWPVSFHRFLP